MENQKEEKEDKKNLGQKVKSKAIIGLLILFGFWIGWDLGAYTYLYKYIPYAREKETLKWVKEYDKYVKDIHKNDNIGGNTPEETIDLFIDALKKGDYELASKYFVAEEQEKWGKKLKEAKRENIIEWTDELEKYKKIWNKEKQNENKFEFWYNTGTGKGEITNSIMIEKNTSNKWKIGGF